MQDDQALLGRAAADYYVTRLARNPKRLNAFDRQLLDLFTSIELHQPDIDARIEQVHVTWKQENFAQRFLDRAKLDMIYSAMAHHLAEQAASLSLQANWTRLLRIGNKHWGGQVIMTQRWVNPPLALQSPSF